MNILFELLNELQYRAERTFTFEFLDGVNHVSKEVFPFVSTEYPCQVYLVVDIKNSTLNNVDNDFLKQLAGAFRKTNFHSPEMDKNTTLIINSCCLDKESLNNEAKVKIEDDPYYFKKYVFSYTPANENLASTFLECKQKEKNSEFSYKNEILNYLMNAEQFAEFKEKNDKLSTYSYFVELATKIPAFPLNIRSSEDIKSVYDFLDEQLKGKEIDAELLDCFISSDIDFKENDIESILAKFEELVTK